MWTSWDGALPLEEVTPGLWCIGNYLLPVITYALRKKGFGLPSSGIQQ